MKKINLIITGCMGRMGKQIIKSAKSNNAFKIAALTENRIVNKKIVGVKPGLNNENEFKKGNLIIDFTVPKCTLEVLKIAVKLRKRVVIGTTGFSKKDENLICLFSGGGSALLTQPAPGITYEDKLIVNKSLLECGASISEINTVRKHLSAIKGGVLANRAFPATVFNFLISDVPGDNPSVIASGPTVPDETTFYDAKNIIEKYKINISDRVTNRLSGNYEETPKPGDKVFSKVYTQIIVRPIDALKAVEKFAKNLGFKTYILGDSLEGESRESAKWHAKIVREIVAKENPINQPIALFSGGETTVTLSKKGIKSGKGGRNTEFLLALAIELDLMKGIYALACDTDGIDGSEDNAGAIIGPDTMTRANHKNINAVKMLESNNSYGFFSSLGDLVVTGPTLTNVNDLRVILLT